MFKNSAMRSRLLIFLSILFGSQSTTGLVGRSNKGRNDFLDEKAGSCKSPEGGSPWRMPMTRVGDKWYYIGHFFKANWFKSAEYCRFHGMHLASITTKAENDAIEDIVQSYGLGHEHFWTSGTDLGEEDSFVWFGTGEKVTFTNWNAGEPNNFRYENGEEEHCLELWNRDGKGLKWNDTPCSFQTYFICQL